MSDWNFKLNAYDSVNKTIKDAFKGYGFEYTNQYLNRDSNNLIDISDILVPKYQTSSSDGKTYTIAQGYTSVSETIDYTQEYHVSNGTNYYLPKLKLMSAYSGLFSGNNEKTHQFVNIKGYMPKLNNSYFKCRLIPYNPLSTEVCTVDSKKATSDSSEYTTKFTIIRNSDNFNISKYYADVIIASYNIEKTSFPNNELPYMLGIVLNSAGGCGGISRCVTEKNISFLDFVNPQYRVKLNVSRLYAGLGGGGGATVVALLDFTQQSQFTITLGKNPSVKSGTYYYTLADANASELTGTNSSISYTKKGTTYTITLTNGQNGYTVPEDPTTYLPNESVPSGGYATNTSGWDNNHCVCVLATCTGGSGGVGASLYDDSIKMLMSSLNTNISNTSYDEWDIYLSEYVNQDSYSSMSTLVDTNWKYTLSSSNSYANLNDNDGYRYNYTKYWSYNADAITCEWRAVAGGSGGICLYDSSMITSMSTTNFSKGGCVNIFNKNGTSYADGDVVGYNGSAGMGGGGAGCFCDLNSSSTNNSGEDIIYTSSTPSTGGGAGAILFY